MTHQTKLNASAITKLQQAYWEAKHNLKNSLGTRDDDCWITTDSDLDSKIQLIQSADDCYSSLLVALLDYKKALCTIMMAEENLGSALVEYGIKDTTHAGKLMTLSGKAISRSANQRAPLKSKVMELYHEVQTFQFKATVDVLQTVSRMEKVRKSYRSGLLWMKNESQNLDPDVAKKVKKFRKVQENIKHLKSRFDSVKLESMQKIDLYLLSRCNLFSKSLPAYREVFCTMSMNYAALTKSVVQNIPSCSSFKFETLKELNEYSVRRMEGGYVRSSKQKNRSKGLHKRKCNVKKQLKCIHLQHVTTSKGKKSQSTQCSMELSICESPINPTKTQQKDSVSQLQDGLFEIDSIDEDKASLKSQSTQCALVKKVKFKDPLESGPTNETSSTISETFLINLNGSEGVIAHKPSEGNSELQFWSLTDNGDLKEPCEEVPICKSLINPTKTRQKDSVSQWEEVLIEFDPIDQDKVPSKDSNFTPAKYSKDLLSIQLVNNVSGDTIKNTDDTANFEKEFEKCMGLFDPVIDAQPQNEESSELHFWSLMENFGDLKEHGEEVSKCKSPINPTRNQQKDSVSKWEDALIEFDPYNESVSKFSDKSAVRENC